MTEAAEKNWVEKMAEDGWKVEFFYNGHADGHYWRSRGYEHQYRFEVAIDGFEDHPVVDAAENKIKILQILRSYGKEAQDLELVWWEGVNNHVPRALVRGWMPSTESHYIEDNLPPRYNYEGQWPPPEADFEVPEELFELYDREHSRPIIKVLGYPTAIGERNG